jgi:hypothetical protein
MMREWRGVAKEKRRATGGDTEKNKMLLPLWLYVWKGGIQLLVAATI